LICIDNDGAIRVRLLWLCADTLKKKQKINFVHEAVSVSITFIVHQWFFLYSQLQLPVHMYNLHNC